jgi:hypothetical protein
MTGRPAIKVPDTEKRRDCGAQMPLGERVCARRIGDVSDFPFDSSLLFNASLHDTPQASDEQNKLGNSECIPLDDGKNIVGRNARWIHGHLHLVKSTKAFLFNSTAFNWP